MKMLDFTSGKGNGFGALMKFSISVGLIILGWILMEVINLVVIGFNKYSVATLALGLRPRQRACKGANQD